MRGKMKGPVIESRIFIIKRIKFLKIAKIIMKLVEDIEKSPVMYAKEDLTIVQLF
jgi:hypothetical protein